MKNEIATFPSQIIMNFADILFPAARRGVRGESGRVYSEGLRSHSEGLRWALPLDKSPLSPFRFKMFLDTFQTYALNSTSKVIIFFSQTITGMQESHTLYGRIPPPTGVLSLQEFAFTLSERD